MTHRLLRAHGVWGVLGGSVMNSVCTFSSYCMRSMTLFAYWVDQMVTFPFTFGILFVSYTLRYWNWSAVAQIDVESSTWTSQKLMHECQKLYLSIVWSHDSTSEFLGLLIRIKKVSLGETYSQQCLWLLLCQFLVHIIMQALRGFAIVLYTIRVTLGIHEFKNLRFVRLGYKRLRTTFNWFSMTVGMVEDSGIRS